MSFYVRATLFVSLYFDPPFFGFQLSGGTVVIPVNYSIFGVENHILRGYFSYWNTVETVMTFLITYKVDRFIMMEGYMRCWRIHPLHLQGIYNCFCRSQKVIAYFVCFQLTNFQLLQYLFINSRVFCLVNFSWEFPLLW